MKYLVVRWIDPVPGLRTFSAIAVPEVKEDGRIDPIAKYDTMEQAQNAADVIQRVYEEEKGRRV